MKLIKVTAYNKTGNIEFTNVLLPHKRVVCRVCNGEGTHVNPNIDGNGIDPQEFIDDPDFAESYFGGVYDVRCEYCNGNKVVDEVDEDACKSRLSWYKGLIRYWNAVQLQRESDLERDQERRLGC